MRTTFQKEYKSYQSLTEMDRNQKGVVKGIKCFRYDKLDKERKKKREKVSFVPMNKLSTLLAKTNNPSICALDPTPASLLKDIFLAILPSLATSIFFSTELT